MKEPAKRDSLLAALARLPQTGMHMDRVTRATVLKARWDAAELYDWGHYILDQLHGGYSSYSIIGSSIRTAGNRFELTVNDKHPEDVARLAGRLRELQVPCYLVWYRLQKQPITP
jgi:hypothetical protein